jgi:CBS domain-containing protein
MTAGEYCNREVIIVEPTISVTEAASLMRQHHVGDLVVVEKQGDKALPVGIITDRDIVIEVVAQEINPDSLIVKDVMSAEPVTVPENLGLLDTLGILKRKGVRRVLIVDDGGSLLGLLSADDAIELIAEQIDDLSRLVKNELKRERNQHP